MKNTTQKALLHVQCALHGLCDLHHSSPGSAGLYDRGFGNKKYTKHKIAKPKKLPKAGKDDGSDSEEGEIIPSKRRKMVIESDSEDDVFDEDHSASVKKLPVSRHIRWDQKTHTSTDLKTGKTHTMWFDDDDDDMSGTHAGTHADTPNDSNDDQYDDDDHGDDVDSSDVDDSKKAKKKARLVKVLTTEIRLDKLHRSFERNAALQDKSFKKFKKKMNQKFKEDEADMYNIPDLNAYTRADANPSRVIPGTNQKVHDPVKHVRERLLKLAENIQTTENAGDIRFLKPDWFDDQNFNPEKRFNREADWNAENIAKFYHSAPGKKRATPPIDWPHCNFDKLQTQYSNGVIMKKGKPTASLNAKQKRMLQEGLRKSFVLDWIFHFSDDVNAFKPELQKTSIVLYVAKSTIEGGGMGLFSNIQLPTGTYITHYEGLHVPHMFSQPRANGNGKQKCLCQTLIHCTREEATLKLQGKSLLSLGICCLYSNSHKLRSRNSDEKIIGIDGLHHQWKYYGVGLGAASWLNSKPPKTCNCRWDSADSDLSGFPVRYVVAKQDIKPGEELFVDYDVQDRGSN